MFQKSEAGDSTTLGPWRNAEYRKFHTMLKDLDDSLVGKTDVKPKDMTAVHISWCMGGKHRSHAWKLRAVAQAPNIERRESSPTP